MSSPQAKSSSYVDHVAQLEARLSTDEALQRAVGGEFLAIGKLEYHLLRSRGLRDDQVVVDVGCGSGRLACQLAAFPGIRYIGCDVVPRLLDYARELCGRPDWKFIHSNGTTIPCGDGEADFVCFFSVFTHLSQEDVFRYFREAHRVLKPGGVMLMSFLEFRNASHWAAFIASVDGTRDDEHLNQFVDREAIQAWAGATGFEVRRIHGGDTNYIPLPEPIRFETGAIAEGIASLGQSVAVLQKRFAFGTPKESEPSVSATPQGAPTATAASTAGLKNVSARARVPRGGSIAAGFIVGGDTAQRLLIRAIGPSLRVFGVAEPLEKPVLEIHAGDSVLARTSGGWRGAPELAAAMATAGAFAVAAESNDGALLVTLPPGSYSAVAKGATPADEGEVLLEVYVLS